MKTVKIAYKFRYHDKASNSVEIGDDTLVLDIADGVADALINKPCNYDKGYQYSNLMEKMLRSLETLRGHSYCRDFSFEIRSV